MLLALAGLLALATADGANVLLARARAQTAADSAALAAAAVMWEDADPAEAARAMAARNGAELEACACDEAAEGARVTVSMPTRIRILRVAPSRVSASARATTDAAQVFRPP